MVYMKSTILLQYFLSNWKGETGGRKEYSWIFMFIEVLALQGHYQGRILQQDIRGKKSTCKIEPDLWKRMENSWKGLNSWKDYCKQLLLEWQVQEICCTLRKMQIYSINSFRDCNFWRSAWLRLSITLEYLAWTHCSVEHGKAIIYLSKVG